MGEKTEKMKRTYKKELNQVQGEIDGVWKDKSVK